MHTAGKSTMNVLDVSCPVHKAVAVEIPMTNPLDEPIDLTALYSHPTIMGPAAFHLEPEETTTMEFYFAPTQVCICNCPSSVVPHSLLFVNGDGVRRCAHAGACTWWWYSCMCMSRRIVCFIWKRMECYFPPTQVRAVLPLFCSICFA